MIVKYVNINNKIKMIKIGNKINFNGKNKGKCSNIISNKKAEIAINTIFYIMMGLFMVWILVFGFNKIFLVQDVLSDHERLSIKEEIKDAINYCEDPLNYGNMKIFEFKHDKFNSVCVLGDDILDDDVYSDKKEFKDIYSAGNNIILVKTKFEPDKMNNDKYIFEMYNIIDDFSIDYKIENTICWWDVENTNKIVMEISCKK